MLLYDQAICFNYESIISCHYSYNSCPILYYSTADICQNVLHLNEKLHYKLHFKKEAL